MLLLCFSLSTAVPSSHLGIAQVSPVTFAKFGATCNTRKMLHQSSCRCRKRGVGVQRQINKPVEALPTTISWVRWWGKLHRTLWGHNLWTHRRPPEPKSFRAEPRHLVGVFWAFLKWNPPLPLLPAHQIKSACRGLSVSMNGGRINDKCSLPSQLAPSHPARKRLNYFNLIAHVSQKSHLSPHSPGPRRHFSTSHFIITLAG